MFELVKTLAEEPAKRKKLLIFYIRMVLSCIVTSVIYIHFYGNYSVLNFYEKEFLPLVFDFFVSGRVLVIGFIFILCYFLLFEILNMIPPLVLSYFTSEKGGDVQFERGMLGTYLSKGGVINRNKTTRKVTVGKNFDEFYYELLDYKNGAIKDAVYNYNYKHSLLFEILTTYFIGIVVFYCFTSVDFPKIIDWIFIIGWLFLAFFYIVISFLIKLFERNSAELITLLQILKVEEIVNSSLKLFKVSFTDSRSNSGIFFSKTITINEQSTLLIYYGTNLNLSSRHINDIVKGSNQLNISEIVLLSNTELTEKAGKFVEQNKEQLTLLRSQIAINEAIL